MEDKDFDILVVLGREHLIPIVKCLLKHEDELSDGYDHYIGFNNSDDFYVELSNIAQDIYDECCWGIRDRDQERAEKRKEIRDETI